MAVFFTADLHIGHRNIFTFCPNMRKGAHVVEMEKLMLEKWHEQVAPDDVVYCLGDVSFTNMTNTDSFLAQLPGKWHLIYGNHDQVIRKNVNLQKRFFSIQEYLEITLDGIRVCLFHYPVIEHNCSHRGAFMLHGHTHGSVTNIPGKILDVGIDTRSAGDMSLWSWDEVKAYMGPRAIEQHHRKGD